MSASFCLAVALLGVSLFGCSTEEEGPSHPLDTDAKKLASQEIPNRRVEGELRGKRFFTHDARVRVTPREGRQRIELFFDDKPIKRCGLPTRARSRRLFVRFDGLTTLPVGEQLVDDREGDKGDVSLHYEVPNEHQFIGHQGGAAALRIDSYDEGIARGSLNVCFDDGYPSCLRGVFKAMPCDSRIDGNALRELPFSARKERVP